MAFTVREFQDLIRLLEEHPQWREQLLHVLFPEAFLDLPRAVAALAEAQRRTEVALEELAEAQRRTEAAIERLTERVDRVERQLAEAAEDRQRIWQAIQETNERMERGFAEAAEDRRRIWEAMQQGFAQAAAERQAMRQDIGRLKGLTKEAFYRDRAVAIFGPLLRRGRDITEQVVERLRAAQQAGQITPVELRNVLAADLLWSGRVWDTGEQVVLVVEASWTVAIGDVERAAERAAILRRAGLRALAVTAGEEWPAEVEAHARAQQVVIVQDGRVDETSWQEALRQL